MASTLSGTLSVEVTSSDIDTQTVSHLIQSWMGDFNAQAVTDRLTFLRSRAGELRQRLDAITAEVDAIDREMDLAEAALKFHDRIHQSTDSSVSPSARTATTDRKRGRDAVMTIMRDSGSRRWTATQMLDEMIERGWADGKGDYHAVQVAMSRLARDKKIARPAYG
jgi:hypothetical protein